MNCQDYVYSNEYGDYILDFQPTQEWLDSSDFCSIPVKDSLSVYYILRKQMEEIYPSAFRYLYIPKLYGQMDVGAGLTQGTLPPDYGFLEESGIAPLKNAPLSLNGENVIIGIIDGGFSIRQLKEKFPDYRDKILSYWDQSRPCASPPTDFGYGCEYQGNELGEVSGSDEEDEHGTALTLIAAGEGLYGVAPEAKVILVKLKQAKEYLKNYYCIPSDVPCYEENDILFACRYISKKAAQIRLPLILLLGVGTSFGDHAGGSFLSRYASFLMEQRNEIWVVPAGNDGLSATHFRGVLFENGQIQSSEIRVGEGNTGFLLEIWGSMPNRFEVSLRSPYGEEITAAASINGKTKEYRFVFEKTIIFADALITEQLSGQQLTALRFLNPTPGIWTIFVKAENIQPGAPYNMYLPMAQFQSSRVYFLVSSPEQTLCAPVINENVLVVSAYRGQDGGIAPFSSRGFSINFLIKPDFTAPGEKIPWENGTISGTSASAAITAGAAALFMEWAVSRKQFPLLNARELRNILSAGCNRDSLLSGMTGYPNREWGFGKLDLQNSFNLLI
ncbi:MAG: S8 family peptidase [Lachnospiraceae bacterium]|nr:S8 family peptidase [Lachnospiraceae bacterium]